MWNFISWKSKFAPTHIYKIYKYGSYYHSKLSNIHFKFTFKIKQSFHFTTRNQKEKVKQVSNYLLQLDCSYQDCRENTEEIHILIFTVKIFTSIESICYAPYGRALSYAIASLNHHHCYNLLSIKNSNKAWNLFSNWSNQFSYIHNRWDRGLNRKC